MAQTDAKPDLPPNERSLIAYVERFRVENYPEQSQDKGFEYFVNSEVLKDSELTPEEVESGIVDGKNDGGIDAFYVFLDGQLVTDDGLEDAVASIKKQRRASPEIQVYSVQSKNVSNFGPGPWNKVGDAIEDLLQSERDESILEKTYNPKVLRQTRIYNSVYSAAIDKFPAITFSALYVTRGDRDNIDPNRDAARRRAEDRIKSRLPYDARVNLEELGAVQLLEEHRSQVVQPAKIAFADLIRAGNESTDSYIGIVKIKDYLEFIRDPAGVIRGEIFADNVRDFEGGTEVNSSIEGTVRESNNTDFWWMNNGVTVIGDRVVGQQKQLTVSSPMIVNGLQTSYVLHNSQRAGLLHEDRLREGLVVKIIQTQDIEVKDRVISGTNRQNPVPPNSLRATEEIQKQIETHLKAFDWHYERRKNYYKNKGVKAARRINFLYLSQIMMSMHLGLPDQARARPGSYLRRDGVYGKIFSKDINLDAYLAAIQLFKGIESKVKSSHDASLAQDDANLRFYVPVVYAMLHKGVSRFDQMVFVKDFRRYANWDEEAFAVALRLISSTVRTYERAEGIKNRDTIFKNADFREILLRRAGRVGALMRLGPEKTVGAE